MLKETIARRYTAALFALAKEAGSADATAQELDSFVGALDKEPSAREFYASPVVDRAEKVELLRQSLASRISELTFNFIVLLVRKRRENLIDTIARQMHEMLDADAGDTVASIATPKALHPDELAELARRLSHVYKRKIIPQGRVDESMLGGVVVQMGDTYVDASVAGKLEEIRRHLLSGVEAATATSPNGKTSA
ncbi:MAG TPA: ATP synthase F1 subunit delta [Candidatus Eremiobacteraceae bacterium]|nr:ATP synthase F1 subunit delta [Candidatus Eremiobacteraceae bacterium]